MRFANIEYFKYAWWLLAGAMLLWLYIYWRQKKVSAIAGNSFLALILPGHQKRNYLISGILMLAGSAFIILALANPTGSSQPLKAETKSLDVVFALDVSKSMDAQDLKPSRLERAVQFIRDMGRTMPGYKMGLVVFAGNAYVQMPLTTDANALNLFLANTNTNIIAEQGTAIGQAIASAKGLLFPNGRPEPGTPSAARAIILITDGEDHEGESTEAAEEAGRDGITIETVGTGTQTGAPIPVMVNGGLDHYIKDKDGETVVSKMDETVLADIASAAHGKFYNLRDDPDVAGNLAKELDAMAKGEKQVAVFDVRQTKFQWFAGAALFLLCFETAFRTGMIQKRKENEG